MGGWEHVAESPMKTRRVCNVAATFAEVKTVARQENDQDAQGEGETEPQQEKPAYQMEKGNEQQKQKQTQRKDEESRVILQQQLEPSTQQNETQKVAAAATARICHRAL